MTFTLHCISSAVVAFMPIVNDPHIDEPRSVPIMMDAEFDDWKDIAPALIDPADAASAAVDFGEVRVSHDDRFVYLLIDFGRTVNAQGLDGHAMILLNADGNPDSGTRVHELNGVDLIIDLTPPNARSFDRVGVGMGIRSTTYTPNPNDVNAKKLSVHDVNLAFGPTHAGRRIEFRIDRGVELPNTPPLFEGEKFVGELVFVDLKGEVADETDSFVHELARATPQAAGEQRQATPAPHGNAGSRDEAANAPSIDPLARAASTDLRVMTWNVQRGAMFVISDPFVRTFRALNPDVILLQELTDKNSADQVRVFLNRAVPLPHDGSWNVVFGSGGGDLRCAVASRHAVHDTPAMQLIPMPDRPDRSVRAVGAIVEHNNKRLLCVSAHLRCCGRAGGPEDDQRVLEAKTISAVVELLKRTEQIDGVVIAGDFNLVGSRDPMEIMAAGLDVDQSALTAAHAYQLDGLSNATWSDPLQPFAPGRLDILLFSDGSLGLDRAFVYESHDLEPRWQEHHQVQRGDSVECSDHRPIVADVGWIVRD